LLQPLKLPIQQVAGHLEQLFQAGAGNDCELDLQFPWMYQTPDSPRRCSVYLTGQPEPSGRAVLYTNETSAEVYGSVENDFGLLVRPYELSIHNRRYLVPA
jgi:hypothetical protein